MKAEDLSMISKLRSIWGIYCRPNLKLIVCAPSKCGSTSIFTALINAGETDRVGFNPFTPEYLEELNVHAHVRSLLPDHKDLSGFFCDSDFLKVLVVRDPLERLASAILSKYLIPGGNIAKELSVLGFSPPIRYEDAGSFIESFNEAARLLLALPLVTGKHGSHVRPISSISASTVRSAFDVVIDISKGKSGFTKLEKMIRSHFDSLDLSFPSFSRLNESPIPTDTSLFSRSIVQKALVYYEQDYQAFNFSVPCVSSWNQTTPGRVQVNGLNAFLGAAARFNFLWDERRTLSSLFLADESVSTGRMVQYIAELQKKRASHYCSQGDNDCHFKLNEKNVNSDTEIAPADAGPGMDESDSGTKKKAQSLSEERLNMVVRMLKNLKQIVGPSS